VTPMAATATAADLSLVWLILAAVLAAWTAVYAVACYVWPFKNCRRCEGSGKRRSPSGKAWRRCRRCKGGGARLRFGRWIWNRARRLHRESA
jgi:hypothetical protein